VPSKYVKGLLEAHDIHVDEVIPHGIAYYPPDSIPRKDIDFLYIGEPQKRKVPPWAYPVLQALQDRLALVSDLKHPDIRALRPKIAYQNMKAGVALGYLYGYGPSYTESILTLTLLLKCVSKRGLWPYAFRGRGLWGNTDSP